MFCLVQVRLFRREEKSLKLNLALCMLGKCSTIERYHQPNATGHKAKETLS